MAEDIKTVQEKAPSNGGLSVKQQKKFKPGRVLRIWDATGNPILVNDDGFFAPKDAADIENLEYHASVGNIEVA